MDSSLPAGRCVTVLLPGGVGLTAGAAGQILALARRRCGAPVWAGAAADVFSGPGGTLLILREVRCDARLAEYALPFIHKYFKD